MAHVDLYRLEQPVELDDLGLEEWFDRDDVVTVVEWPKWLKDHDFSNLKKIKLDISGGGREISFT